MLHNQNAYLLINKGEPFAKGTSIPISKSKIIIGRHDPKKEPDISFINPVISRNHLIIELKNGSYYAIDTSSKNGTLINGKKLTKSVYYDIHNGDQLQLADDAAILHFSCEAQISTITIQEKEKDLYVDFNHSRRELFILDKKIVLSGNLYNLFYVLYQNRGKVVSHSEIKKSVWAERACDENGIPFTSDEEINVLIMRLRKKLGPYRWIINNLRGHGYMLNTNQL